MMNHLYHQKHQSVQKVYKVYKNNTILWKLLLILFPLYMTMSKEKLLERQLTLGVLFFYVT